MQKITSVKNQIAEKASSLSVHLAKNNLTKQHVLLIFLEGLLVLPNNRCHLLFVTLYLHVFYCSISDRYCNN